MVKITFKTGYEILCSRILRRGQRVPCWLRVLQLCWWQSIHVLFMDRHIYTHIRSNGRIEVRKLCTINNGAKCRHIDINIIPDLNQYFYVKNYPDIHNRRINCSCVVGSPFMYWLYIYIYIYIYINNT